MRCSAERPRTSNRVWSARTRCSRLSAWTRASADCEPACSATPVWHGRSRASARSTTRCSKSSSITEPHDVELDEAGPAGVGGELVAVLVGVEADDAGLQPQRQVLGDHDDVVALARQAERHGEDAVVVGVGA